jgi:hypothetical protein
VLNRRGAAFLLFALLFSSACSAAPGGAPTTTPVHAASTVVATVAVAPTASPVSTPPGELILQQEIAFGPGSFDFTDTQAGLSDLSSYTATLTLSFSGTRAGNSETWSKTYVMLAATDPPARQWTIETSGDLSNSEMVYLAEMDGVDYERRGEQACTASAVPEGDPLSGRLALASFLTGVIGAEAVGQDTVNNVATDHYTFDQRALGEEGLTKASGELWIAADGDYIVKYLLNTQGNEDYFGEGIEGTLTLDYQLSDVNQGEIVLPADCPPGMVDAPLLPDAADIVKVPGLLAYDTSTSLEDTAAFYQEQIPGLGWEAVGEPDVAEAMQMLKYTRDDLRMTVLLTAESGKTTVNITVERSQE